MKSRAQQFFLLFEAVNIFSPCYIWNNLALTPVLRAFQRGEPIRAMPLDRRCQSLAAAGVRFEGAQTTFLVI